MSIGTIGFGEVGKIFSQALRRAGAVVATWDVNFLDPNRVGVEHEHARQADVFACTSMADLVGRSELVFSAVTASQTLAAVLEAAPHLRPGTTFVDLNSVSPRTKVLCAELVEAGGGRYVEAAIMTSVPRYGIRVPIMLCGPRAAECATSLNAWGMDATAVSGELGVASTIKMCRSVIVKGLEALVVESFIAARAYGVEDAVLSSLTETFPGMDWDEQGRYFFERVIQHGERRAEEMGEVAATIAETGIASYMAAATLRRQAWVADLARQGIFNPQANSWRSHADAVLSSIKGASPDHKS